ncbi:MAG: AAA domain-containing protein [Bacteroidaceae bacterium]
MTKEKIEKKDDILLQDIWKIHTDVQEQMLQLRSAPVRVVPESAKIVGEKLYLRVDENDKTDRFLESIEKVFSIGSNDINITDGYFYVDINKAQEVSSHQKSELAQKASANFIEFLPNPIIDGYVNKLKSPISDLQDLMTKSNFDYDFDRNGRLQITIKDLKSLNRICSDNSFNVQIPEKSSIIIPVYPNPLFFIKREFPFLPATYKTRTYKRKVNENDISWSRTIEISEGYLKEDVAEKFNKEFGLFLIGYDFVFYINPSVVSKYNPKESSYVLPKLNKENNSFLFHTILNVNSQDREMLIGYNEEKWDFNLKYSRLNKFFINFFGSENVRFESKFIYAYDSYKFTTEFLPSIEYENEAFWQEIYNTIFTDKVSVSENTETIGIDFDWRNENIEDIILNTVNQCPILNFHLFNNHRCNIDFQIQDISLYETENQLREKFPSIKTKRDNRNGTLYFYQEYQSIEQAIMLNDMILSELNVFDSNVYDIELYDIPRNKEKYMLFVDNLAKKESQIAAIKEIRGADFNVNGSHLGKLFRVNFPEMIFDISGDNFEKNKKLFEAKVIGTIEPNLVGDIEKINRLKSSLSNIVNGNNLQNPNLKDFIFDSSKANEIENIAFHINSSSETYCDLNNHLLNNRVNEPQKEAILKTLQAEDLALIQGPPGTGKSTAIAEIIWQHIRKNSKERILLTSETNLAVDNAIDRIVNNHHNLVKPIRFGCEEKLEIEGRQFSIETMKKWVENGVIEIDTKEINDDEENLPQKLILQNWIENIKRRIQQNELDVSINELWKITLSNPPKILRQIFYNNYVRNCNVIGATCSSIGKYNKYLSDLLSEEYHKKISIPTNFYKTFCEIFGIKKVDRNKDGLVKEKFSEVDLSFTTVIQDESSKATPAELSLPLIYGKKNIIIGDHRQLPPMLDKESFMMSFDFLLDRIESEEESQKIKKLKNFVSKHFDQLEISHFERLFEKIDDSLKGILNLQYRMHPDINEVIKQFYINDGGLECGLVNPIDLGVNDPNMNNPASRYHGIEIESLISSNNHVVWIDTDSPELLDGTSRINYGEVEAIQEILTKFHESESFHQYQNVWDNPEDQQIGLISFYGKQIRLLKDLRNKFKDIPIRVSTVDRFQGMERNIIIVSMVRSNRIATDKNQKPDETLYGSLGFQEQTDLGFAQSPNRLNVALSRAKRLLIIVGNSELFSQKEIYKNVYQTIANNPNGRIIKYETK